MHHHNLPSFPTRRSSDLTTTGSELTRPTSSPLPLLTYRMTTAAPTASVVRRPVALPTSTTISATAVSSTGIVNPTDPNTATGISTIATSTVSTARPRAVPTRDLANHSDATTGMAAP